MKTIAAFRDFSNRLSGGLGNAVTQGRTAVKKRFRRSWPGRVAWPWFRSELEVVAKVAGVVTLSSGSSARSSSSSERKYSTNRSSVAR